MERSDADDRDWARLYDQHRRGLYAVALAVCGCPGRAEDAVHEAFVRLVRGRTPAAPVAYAFAAVRAAAIDQRRRSRRGRAPPFADPAAEAPDPLVERELRDRVGAALAELPDEQREAIAMRIWGGLSFADMAEAVGAPMATVAARYRRGLERLRHRLAEAGRP